MRQGKQWLEFRGMGSDALGVRVLKLPERVRAKQRGQAVSVPGRSGGLWLPDGSYEDIRLSAILQLESDKQTEVCAWLCGSGLLRCSDAPGECYRARAAGELVFHRVSAGVCSVEVIFDAEPFRYLYPAQTLTLTAPQMLLNPGTAPADPRITLYASGDAVLLIGSKTLLISGISGHIVLDSEAKIAYKELSLLTSKLTGDWPTIPPGAAMLSWTGDVTRLEIEPNWRNL